MFSPGRLARDARLLAELYRTFSRLRNLRPDTPTCIADFIDPHVERDPDRPALVGEERTLSWAEMDAEANRVAHWALGQGLGRGDVVGLSMQNRPEYVVTWLGLSRVGVVTALLNTNLVGERLAHCLRQAACRHWIAGAELAEACASALPHLEEAPRIWRSGGPAPALREALDLDAALAAAPAGEPDPAARRGLRAGDVLFYIYTSGTTGLPKAARVSHLRFLASGFATAGAQRLGADDRVYVPLPLYHSAGGMMATAGTLMSGATLLIARGFSASRFWSDCVRLRASAFQYIGELCRYLLNSPEHPDERRHSLRVCLGNGLRPEVWGPFQERFRIPRIVEFYGATEGNVVLVNLEGRVGSVGRLPGLLRRLVGVELVRFDVEREEVVRGADGRCLRCGPGEVGEAIGRITAISRFEGYTSSEATEKKILRDVFRPGDAYFRTGDLLRRDAEGFFYFVDRIGDTFRWKGENVSTSEVAEVVSTTPGVLEVNVYGVSVPGADGRAGMAALVVEPGFDLRELAARVDAELATYARPLFVRILPAMEVTGTFKHRKLPLVEQGFDPAVVRDPLYVRGPAGGGYAPLDRELFLRIAAGHWRL